MKRLIEEKDQDLVHWKKKKLNIPKNLPIQDGLGFQNTFDQCLRNILQQDQASFIPLGFNTLLDYSIPLIVKTHGQVTTLLHGLKFTLSIDDVITYNTAATISDHFDFGQSRVFPITAKLTLDVIPLLAIGTKEPTIISQVRCPIVHLHVSTGRTFLDCPVLDDPDYMNQFLPSGAFISNGKIRTLGAIKSRRNNTMILGCKKGLIQLQVRSAPPEKPFRSTSSVNFSINPNVKKSYMEGIISCKIPFATKEIHVGVLAIAFGCKPGEFISLIKESMGKNYDPVIFRPYEISLMYDQSVQQATNQEEAILMISGLFEKDSMNTGMNQLKTELFPHINIGFKDKESMYKAKLTYLVRCTCIIILFAANRIQDTPRDFWRHSSIITPAHFIGGFFRKRFLLHMNKFVNKNLRKSLMKVFKQPLIDTSYIDLQSVYCENRLTSVISSAIASGTWGPKQKGVTNPLNSNNGDGLLGQILKMYSSLATTDSSHTQPRQVQTDSFNYIDALSTPDGEQVGLVFEPAALAYITPDVPYPIHLCHLLESLFKDYLIDIHTSRNHNNNIYHYINNCGILTHYILEEKLDAFVNKFRQHRRNGDFTPFAFLQKFEDRQEIHVICEGGQIVKPVIVADNIWFAKPEMSFNDMLCQGIVEYINPAEEMSLCFVASTFYDFLEYEYNHLSGQKQKITHIELSQATFVNRFVLAVPFLTSIQGARGSYYSQQVKQKCTADLKKMHGSVLTTQLWNSCKPIVTTNTARKVPSNTVGRGFLAVIAYLAYPFNQEDAILVNKASVERGMGTVSTIRHYVSDISTNTITTMSNKNNQIQSIEKFEKPKEALTRQNKDYSTVGLNGLPKPGTYIPGSGIVLAKTRTTKTNHNGIIQTKLTDISTSSRHDEEGIVQNVSRVIVPEGERVTVDVSTKRELKVGDKVSTLYSSKGVIAHLEAQENLPYSLQTGCAPDVIFSPLGAVSRMIMAACLIEGLTGKTVCLAGDLTLGIDHQRFDEGPEKHEAKIRSLLHKYGFASNGSEIYIDGTTGEMIGTKDKETGIVKPIEIFTGIAEMSRLPHIASKKSHARDIGRRDLLTRQPNEGRRYGGGLRNGPMEGAALGAHGASRVFQNRFHQQSDPGKIAVCTKCHLPADVNFQINYTWCRTCSSRNYVVQVPMCHTFWICYQELAAMGILIRIATTDEEFKEIQTNYNFEKTSNDMWMIMSRFQNQ